jgi:hypothetical protein
MSRDINGLNKTEARAFSINLDYKPLRFKQDRMREGLMLPHAFGMVRLCLSTIFVAHGTGNMTLIF